MSFLESFITSLYETALNLGLPGVFLLSLVSNLIIFIPVPYLLLVFVLSTQIHINIVELSFISGLGAAIGKLIIFEISKRGGKLVNEKSHRNLEFARLIMERFGILAVFLVAALPLPDDVFYIPMGLAQYTALKFFLPCLAGKFLLTLAIALGGRYSVSWISRIISPDSPLTIIATAAFIVVSIYATFKINWETIFVKYFLKKEEDKSDREK